MHTLPHRPRFDAQSVAELKERVYGHMLSTRKDKYTPWVRGIKRYRGWVPVAERYLAALGGTYFKDAVLRIELIEAIYVALRLVDDIVDRDAPLPEGFSSSVAYVTSLIAFVDSSRKPLNMVEDLFTYAFDLGRQLGIDMKPVVRDILGSLLFDAKRQEAQELQIFDRATLEHHFHLLDIRGTIGGCLMVAREPAEAWEIIEPLGRATRIRYDLRDHDEDMRANLCNIPKEDVLDFGIEDVRDTRSSTMLRWRRHKAQHGLTLLETYARRKRDADLHRFTRTLLFRAYERPAEKHLKQVLKETARTTS